MRIRLICLSIFASSSALAAEPIMVSGDRAVSPLVAQEAIGIFAVDAAYPALRAGDNAAAIAQLSGDLARENDPARLINLGTALARTGRRAEAAAMFRRAMTSPVRYDLELASGRFQDSRWTARAALALLDTPPERLASR